MAPVIIYIAKQFSRFPGGRLTTDGPSSAEELRKTLLVPALRRAEATGERVTVSLDGTMGYAASFLEEAFGGLVRVDWFTAERLLGAMDVSSIEAPEYATKARQYVVAADEERRANDE